MNIVVLALGTDWVAAARLPGTLVKAGFRVIACCPEGSLMLQTRFLHGSARLDRLTMNGVWTALKQICRTWGADFILPGDEPAVRALHAFAANLPIDQAEDDAQVAALIRMSLGRSAGQAAVVRRSALADLPVLKDVAFPQQRASRSGDIQHAVRDLGFPVVVKKDFTAGGCGVWQIRNDAELFALISRPELFDSSTGDVLVQRLIIGREVSVSFAASDGVIAAAFAYTKVRGYPNCFGPTSVAEHFSRTEVLDIAAALVRHVGFTGFGGIDLIISEADDRPYVIELNPRPTITSHLGGVFGADLGAAFYAALTGRPSSAPGKIRHHTVALFPGEWARHPSSPYLTESYHDVPWDDPPLFEALINLKRNRMPSPK